MSTPETPEPPKCFNGSYQEYDEKCQECKWATESQAGKKNCKEKRQEIRREFSRIIQKSGMRRWFLAFQQALGDLMLSRPDDIIGRMFLLFEAFEKAYGVTRRGLTGLVDEKLHKKAVQAEVDLHMLKTAMKTWDNKPSTAEFKRRVSSPLVVLEKKYGKMFKVDLTGKPAELLSHVLFYIKINLAPEMEFVVDNIASLMMEGTSDVITESDRFRRIDDPRAEA